MAFYKDFEDKPSKRGDWRDDAQTLRPGQANGGRPSHAARNQGGMRLPGRPVEDHTLERAGFAPRRGDRPTREGEPERRFDRSDRTERTDRTDRPSRPYGDRADRTDRTDRPSRPYGDRSDRTDRTDRPSRAYGDRSDRTDRTDHPSRPYGDRGERTDRTDRPSRPYGDRSERFDRSDRSDRPNRPAFEERPAAPAAEVPENVLVGRNPIREAIRSGHDIEKLLIARGELIGSAREIVGMARERRIIVQEVDRTRLDAIAPNHQGMIAFASAFAYSTVDEILETAQARGEEPFLILLDGVTDPHNLGAIIRSAECAGAHGVIVPERRAVGLTPAAVKASAGAVEHLKVARVGNMARLVEQLKTQGIWTYAAVMEGESYDRMDLTGPIALVIGAEGEGVSRLVKEKCDGLVSLPMRGKIDSLNASVAAGVLMYAVVRARDARKP